MKSICAAVSAGLVALFAPADARAIGGRDTPPLPSAPHATRFAKPKETRLANGLRVVVVERHELPLLAAQMLLRNGAEADPPERAGAADVTASLLIQGTEKMSAPQIADAIESLGGTIFSGGGWNSASAGMVVMSDKAQPAFEVLSDVVLHPTFKEEELERLRKQMLDSLRVEMQQPGSVADYARVRVVFPAGEYAHPRSGTLETLQAITRDDVTRLYRTIYRPDNAVLVLVGDVTVQDGKALAQKYFGSWKAAGSSSTRGQATNSKDWKPRHVVIDMPQAGQAAVLLARPAFKRASTAYYAGVVANAALGSGLASRLNREIRIKRGLSYGAGSHLDLRRDAGQFIARAQTKNESAPEVARLMEAELRRLANEPVQGDELTSRQAMLIGSYARNMETNLGVAGQITNLITCDLPLNTLDKYIPSINKVTPHDITSFAQKYIAQPSALIVVGQASAFVDSLKKDWKDVEVIPQSNLDLNRADLLKAKIGAADE
jgi:zinc protease